MPFDGQLGMQVNTDAELFKCSIAKLERYRWLLGRSRATVESVLGGLVDSVAWVNDADVDGDASQRHVDRPQIFVDGSGGITHVRLICLTRSPASCPVGCCWGTLGPET